MPVWSVLGRGMYTLHYMGHDLIVKRLRKIDQVRRHEKKYQIFVDGVLADMGWNTPDSKRKAEIIAETLAPGEPVPPLTCRQPVWTPGDVDGPPTRAQYALEAIQQAEDSISEPVPAPASAITYTLAGALAGDTEAALATIRQAVELLRRRGDVRCEVVLTQAISV